MPWSGGAAYTWLVAALNTDIMQEFSAADRYVQLAQLVKQLHHPDVYRKVAACAATALTNATALAAEMIALGASPPIALRRAPSPLPPPKTVEEHLIAAKADVVHYSDRLAVAKRLGLTRLQEVFRDIVMNKRRHLADAATLASASAKPRPRPT